MATQDSRIRLKRSTKAGEVPTVAPSNDHTDGTWGPLDIYVGEAFLNVADDRMYICTKSGIKEVGLGNAGVFTAKLVIPSAQVLTLFTTPVPFGINVPIGYYVQPIGDIMIKGDYNTTAYATNTSVRIRSVGGSQNYVSAVNVLAFSADIFIPLTKNVVSSGKAIETGEDLEVYVPVGNPTAGDSDITLYLTYTLIPI
jgi:hypothetical protein